MRNNVSAGAGTTPEAVPACDRCGERSRYTHLLGYPLNGSTYWLCAECQLAVVTIWLAEHEPQMQRRRGERR